MNRYKPLKYLTSFVAWTFTVSICYSRIYVGRHSIDQVISGALTGYLLAHFSWYYYKPHIFEPAISQETTKE